MKVTEFKPGDIIQYASSSSVLGENYDLLLRKTESSYYSATFEVICLEDGYRQHITYYENEKYRVH